MFDLAKGTSHPLEYEDIVVRSWELFPDEFGLRKYVRQYPDSSDQHKSLYGPLKDRGFVLSGNKKFRLTEKGITYAATIQEALKKGNTLQSESTEGKADRLSRDKEAQLKRIWETDAFRLFSNGNQEGILDTDFYTYLGVTVRTDRHEFLGRLSTVTDAVTDAIRIAPGNERFSMALRMHSFLCDKFKNVIDRNKGSK